MTPTCMRAAIYVRQSLDVQEGIDRQLERCRKMIAERGWVEVDIYVDNDTSASKDRGADTQWARLLNDFRIGRIDVVVAVQLDRVIRRVKDIDTLIDMGAKMTTVDGEIDLSTPHGVFIATLGASLARLEVARKAERQQRANEFAARKGTQKASQRAFGYELDNTPHPTEADLLRSLYEEVLAGASLFGLVSRLNAEGIKTPRGSEWKRITLRTILLNPKNCGLSVYRGAVVGEGQWEPIISRELFDAAEVILKRHQRGSETPAQTRHLLSGISYCGVCGGKMFATGPRKGNRMYRCSSVGTGHSVTRRADHIEALVVATVLDTLKNRTPKMEPLEGSEALPELFRLADEYHEKLKGLAADYAEGILTREQVGIVSRTVQAKLTDVNQLIAALSVNDVASPLLNSEDIAASFEELTFEEQRRVIAGTVKVSMLPNPASGPKFRPETVLIEPVAV